MSGSSTTVCGRSLACAALLACSCQWTAGFSSQPMDAPLDEGVADLAGDNAVDGAADARSDAPADVAGDRGPDHADHGLDSAADHSLAADHGPDADHGLDLPEDHGLDSAADHALDSAADHSLDQAADRPPDHGQPEGMPPELSLPDFTPPDQLSPDASEPDLDCRGLYECHNACGSNPSCHEHCRERGTEQARSRYQAIVDCRDEARQGACATECTTGDSWACKLCLDGACEEDLKACIPQIASFGDVCSGPMDCKEDLVCVGNGTAGICTRRCEFVGYACTGGPAKTLPACIMIVGGQPYCAFVCQLGSWQWPCPSTTECFPTPEPPGSDQHICRSF